MKKNIIYRIIAIICLCSFSVLLKSEERTCDKNCKMSSADKIITPPNAENIDAYDNRLMHHDDFIIKI
ncbi:MAG: hypothetical protein H0W12_02445 [Chitinophagaceae bacterium]|nr:hypothetical protein [Chitinophagaceae bacterium]